MTQEKVMGNITFYALRQEWLIITFSNCFNVSINTDTYFCTNHSSNIEIYLEAAQRIYVHIIQLFGANSSFRFVFWFNTNLWIIRFIDLQIYLKLNSFQHDLIFFFSMNGSILLSIMFLVKHGYSSQLDSTPAYIPPPGRALNEDKKGK